MSYYDEMMKKKSTIWRCDSCGFIIEKAALSSATRAHACGNQGTGRPGQTGTFHPENIDSLARGSSSSSASSSTTSTTTTDDSDEEDSD